MSQRYFFSRYIQRKAFNSLSLRRVTLSGLTVKEEVATEAFNDVDAEDFVLEDSVLKELDREAVGVRIGESFR